MVSVMAAPSGKQQPVVGGVFEIEFKLGAGGFGQVYLGSNIHTGADVAIKVEPRKNRELAKEANVYKSLAHDALSPACHWYGTDMFDNTVYNILVLDLMGPSLSRLLCLCGGCFNEQTMLSLAPQIMNGLEHLHTAGFIHQDVKPSNFVLGLREGLQKVFVVDFGLAKSFKHYNAESGREEHIPYRQVQGRSGTAHYASVNAHLGKEQSRRDDLEAVAYMLIEFQEGGLPWQALGGDDLAEAQQLIAKMMLPDELRQDLCNELAALLRYCRGLGFDERPDYDYLRSLFEEALSRRGYQEDSPFQWEETSEFSKFKLTGSLPILLPTFCDESEISVSAIDAASKSTPPQYWPPCAAPSTTWKCFEMSSAPLQGCIPCHMKAFSHSDWSELIEGMREWFYENEQDLLTTGAEKRRRTEMMLEHMRSFFKNF